MAAPTDSVEISALTAGAALDGTEILPMVQGGATVRNPLSAALTYFNANASLAAARITSGQLALAQGGTGADLSATGGANQIVRQNSAGGVFTVSALAAADIPNLDAGKITTGTLAVARGGTGIASYTIGDLLYASGATALSALAGVATGNVLLSGGVATAPAWGKVDVTAAITGIVPSANGGTGIDNAGRTLTISTNSGTLAFGAAASTLTIPATGTAALLATANVFTAAQTGQRDNIGTTSTDGAILTNATAAAAGAQQYSPRLRLTGQGWKTNATAASQTVDFILENQPVQSTVSPKPTLIFSSQANGGGYLPLIHVIADTTNAPGASDTVTFVHSSGGNRGLFIRGSMGLSVAGGGTNTAPTTDGGAFIGIGVGGVRLRSSWLYTWAATTDPVTTADAGLGRNAAAVVEINNGTAGQWGALKAGTRDSATNTTSVGLTLGHQSTGTPAASFGIGLKMALNSDTTADQDAAQIEAIWTTATHASRTSNIIFSTVNSAAALAESLRITPSQIIARDGTASAPGLAFNSSNSRGIFYNAGVNVTGGSSSQMRFTTNVTILASGNNFGWTSASAADGGAPDTAIWRNAAGILEINNGTTGQWASLKAGTRDSATNTTSVGLTLGHQSTGTPAASFGIGLKMALNSDTTADQDAAQITALWTTATHASRTADIIFSAVNSAAALAEVARMTGSGNFQATGNITASGGSFIATNNWTVNSAQNRVASGIMFGFSSSATNAAVADAAFRRSGAGAIDAINGTAGQWASLRAGTRDAGTTTITDGLTLGHQSTGTPAAGLGSAIQINIDSSTTADQNAVRLTAEWVVATHASRAARYKINVYDTASRECLRAEASGTAAMIGFLGANAAARQTSGADLTNNVTSGGTDDTIANFTDLTVYANDSAAIRNDIYQLARKLKQVNDALRLYGLLT